MATLSYVFSGKKVQYFLDRPVSELSEIVSGNKLIVVSDENVVRQHPFLQSFNLIVIPAGEQHKNQESVNFIISELIRMKADRTSFIVGVGGGVVTDITGFVASIYMRGLRFGFVPTTILSQVDASIGGKNGIDTGVYKNLIGIIRQPEFILFDFSLLRTLPDAQWVNGFAEVIKHACIKDASLFQLLSEHHIRDFQQDAALLSELIRRNVAIKSDVVEKDEFETGDRKLLNFGHTIGHAIENIYELPHGHAISIGMVAACRISQQLTGLPESDTDKVTDMLSRYGLSTSHVIDPVRVFEILKMDKKRTSESMNFILLSSIGVASVKKIPLTELEQMVNQLF